VRSGVPTMLRRLLSGYVNGRLSHNFIWRERERERERDIFEEESFWGRGLWKSPIVEQISANHSLSPPSDDD
jgi:hypothetical protein